MNPFIFKAIYFRGPMSLPSISFRLHRWPRGPSPPWPADSCFLVKLLNLGFHYLCSTLPYGCFQRLGDFSPKWMVKIMENPMNKWMIWGFPIFLETSISSIWLFSEENGPQKKKKTHKCWVIIAQNPWTSARKCTPLKTNMTLENPYFQQEIHRCSFMVDYPLPCQFPGGGGVSFCE